MAESKSTMHEHTMSYNPMSAPTDEMIDNALGKLESGITHLIVRHDHEHGDRAHHHAPEKLTGAAETSPEAKTQVKKAGLWWGQEDS